MGDTCRYIDPVRTSATCLICKDGHTRYRNTRTGETRHSLPEPFGEWMCTHVDEPTVHTLPPLLASPNRLSPWPAILGVAGSAAVIGWALLKGGRVSW